VKRTPYLAASFFSGNCSPSKSVTGREPMMLSWVMLKLALM
jgi:hypothetical protein